MTIRFPRPTRTWARPLLLRRDFEATRWRAAQQGFVLTRERRLLGALYALTSLGGVTEIFHDLAEVRAYLDGHDPDRAPAP